VSEQDYFVFQFGTNPKLFLCAIRKLLRENVCLLKLVNVDEDDDDDATRPATSERASQTSTHPVVKVR
jgi:hypothetical protein